MSVTELCSSCCALSRRYDQNRDSLTQNIWHVDSRRRHDMSSLNVSHLLSVAAWPAERAAYGATQIWVASGYLHHKSLGVPPQSWRHVDHPRWTLGPATCRLFGPTAPSTLDSHGHLLCPGAGVYTGDPSWALHPSSYYEFTQNPQFSFIPAAPVQNPVSTSLRFLLSQVLLFIWRRAGVCLCVFRPLATFNLSPPLSVPLTFLSPSTPLCAHCKCGTSEYGHRDAGSFIPSCKHVHNGLNIGTDWLTVTRLLVSAWFSFLSKGTKSEPVGQMKKTRLSRHPLCVCFIFVFFFLFAHS